MLIELQQTQEESGHLGHLWLSKYSFNLHITLFKTSNLNASFFSQENKYLIVH
mgnify:CR=1 FL=1